MDIIDGVYNYLASKTLLTALIGSPPKLYPQLGPQAGTISRRPYVIFTCPDIDRIIHLRGASAIGDFYFSFEIYSDDVADRQSIGEALRNILHTRGNVLLTDTNSNTARLDWSELKRDYTGLKSPPDGSENAIMCRTMNFQMMIVEVKPTLP